MRKLRWLFDTLIYYPLFTISLTFMSLVARLKFLRTLKLIAHLNAKLVLLVRMGKRRSTIEDMGKEWKSMFPNDMQRLIKQDADTVYYETHTWCPLRGTGDVTACYRMMEFDRAMHEKIGAQFVVIASQAEAGRKTCVVAMRKSGLPADDLVHAHDRVTQGNSKKTIPLVKVD